MREDNDEMRAKVRTDELITKIRKMVTPDSFFDELDTECKAGNSPTDWERATLAKLDRMVSGDGSATAPAMIDLAGAWTRDRKRIKVMEHSLDDLCNWEDHRAEIATVLDCPGNFGEIKAAVTRLKEDATDWQDSVNRAIDTKGPHDEIHCSCVGALRAEVVMLRKENKRLLYNLTLAACGEGFNLPSSPGWNRLTDEEINNALTPKKT